MNSDPPMLEVARSQTAFGLNKILIRRPRPRRNRYVRTKAIELDPGLGDRCRETVALRRSESAPAHPCYRGRNARRCLYLKRKEAKNIGDQPPDISMRQCLHRCRGAHPFDGFNLPRILRASWIFTHQLHQIEEYDLRHVTDEVMHRASKSWIRYFATGLFRCFALSRCGNGFPFLNLPFGKRHLAGIAPPLYDRNLAPISIVPDEDPPRHENRALGEHNATLLSK